MCSYRKLNTSITSIIPKNIMSILRTCPNCKQKCINPLQFDKNQSYQCKNCHHYVFVPTVFMYLMLAFLSLPWIVEIFGYQLIFYKIFPNFSYFVIATLFIYWAFGYKIDGFIFPLKSVKNIDE